MFLDEKQACARLNSERNLANRFSPSGFSIVEKKIHLAGKKEGSENLSRETRTEIATRARIGENQNEIAREFNITQPAVARIKTGVTKGIDEEKVTKTINEVRDKALDRLMVSLGLITDDKLSGCSAKDLSVIASNMGRVVEKVMPKTESPDNINFIIYSPELRKENAFESIEV